MFPNLIENIPQDSFFHLSLYPKIMFVTVILKTIIF